MKRKFIAASTVSFALMSAPQIAAACAMCGLSPGDSLGHAYNTSVLFMLVGPYVTFGLIGGLVYLKWRRGKRDAEAAAPKR